MSMWGNPIYVIDNTCLDAKNSEINIPAVTYISLGQNLGVGYALNLGCRRAMISGSDFALLLDQDSEITLEQFKNYCLAVNAARVPESAKLFGMSCDDTCLGEDEDFTEVGTVITSGSLVCLKTFALIGGFREDYFIDQIDHEYSFRLRKMGFKVMRYNAALLRHKVGEPTVHSLFGKQFVVTNHDRDRRYYQVRNMLSLRREYPREAEGIKTFLRKRLYEVATILAFERQPIGKLLYGILGVFDFYSGRAGSFASNHPRVHTLFSYIARKRVSDVQPMRNRN